MLKIKEKLIVLEKKDRLYNLEQPIVAITGGIASGKSTFINLLKTKGLQIIDADQLVKNIYATFEAKEFIRSHFPSVFNDHNIDFKKLRELFFSDPQCKSKIEAFIYSKLPNAFKEEVKCITNQNFYIYDVPLLFEKNLEKKVDLSVLIFCEPNQQLIRLIRRDQIPENLAKKIIEQQIDINIKKTKAGLVIDNSQDQGQLELQMETFLQNLLE